MSVELGYRVVCGDCGEECLGYDGQNAWNNEEEAIEAAQWASWRVLMSDPDAHCVCVKCHDDGRPYQNHHRLSQALERVRKKLGATSRDVAQWTKYSELALCKIQSGQMYVPDNDALDIIRELNDRMKPKHMTITLCGSTRFEAWFRAWETALSLLGHTVMSLSAYPSDFKGEKIWYTDEEKRVMDEVHKRKIDASDGIFVLNVAGYIGESTLSEIHHARAKGKRVWFLQQQPQGTIDCVGDSLVSPYNTVVRGLGLIGHKIPIDTNSEPSFNELFDALSLQQRAKVRTFLERREDRVVEEIRAKAAQARPRFNPDAPLEWMEAGDDGFSIAYHGHCMLAVSPTEKTGEWTAELSIFIPGSEGISIQTKTFTCGTNVRAACAEAETLPYREVAAQMEQKLAHVLGDLAERPSDNSKTSQ